LIVLANASTFLFVFFRPTLQVRQQRLLRPAFRLLPEMHFLLLRVPIKTRANSTRSTVPHGHTTLATRSITSR
jgi:hypothetical protein